jgi:acetyl-CoA acetyltransferase
MSFEAFIVGAGETPYRRHPTDGVTTHTLLAEAARAALSSAGIEPRDVDGLGVSSFALSPDRAVDLAVRLGLRVRWLMDGATGGASAIDMLQHARRAVEAGDASTVLLVGGDRLDAPDFVRLVDEYNVYTRDLLAPLPTGGPNALFALLTQRHMHAHGLERSQYGAVAVSQRAWAAENPNAAYREPLTIEEYLAAPLVCDPLTIYDCVPVVAGADALVVASTRASQAPAVRVRAIAVSHNADAHEGDGLATGLGEARERLWDESGAGPHDMDVVAIYDDYPAMVLVQLEDLGFVPDGDVKRLVDERIRTRALPVNTSGGQLSAGQAGAAGGLHGAVEVVTQLRGEAGRRQVPNARLGVVSGYGMVAYRHGASVGAAVLERA